MFKEKWYFIVAFVLAVIFIVKDWFAGREVDGMVNDFRDELQRRVSLKRKEAIDRAEQNHSDAVDTDLDDWLDDELGSGGDGAA